MPTPVAATGNHLRPEPPRLDAPLSATGAGADSVWSHCHHPVSPPSHHWHQQQQQQSSLRLPEVHHGGGRGGGSGGGGSGGDGGDGGGGGCNGGARQKAHLKLTEAANGAVKKKKKKKRWSSQPNPKRQGLWKKLLWVKQDCMAPQEKNRASFLTDYSCRPG